MHILYFNYNVHTALLLKYCNILEKIYEIQTLTKEHTRHALNPRKSLGTVSIDIPIIHTFQIHVKLN